MTFQRFTPKRNVQIQKVTEFSGLIAILGVDSPNIMIDNHIQLQRDCKDQNRCTSKTSSSGHQYLQNDSKQIGRVFAQVRAIVHNMNRLLQQSAFVYHSNQAPSQEYQIQTHSLKITRPHTHITLFYRPLFIITFPDTDLPC
jgi:hypothetical protein